MLIISEIEIFNLKKKNEDKEIIKFIEFVNYLVK